MKFTLFELLQYLIFGSFHSHCIAPIPAFAGMTKKQDHPGLRPPIHRRGISPQKKDRGKAQSFQFS